MAQKINVDSRPGAIMPTLYFSQGDIGREFLLEVVSSDGFNIPVGATVKCVGTKPSGFGFTVPCTFSGNTVTLVASDTEGEVFTDEKGRFPAELRIEANGDVIGTANFYMFSEKNPHPSGTTDGEAAEIIPELTLLVERVEKAASDILDMQVVANTLPAGSDATYSYDADTNTATFGVPKGADGSLASGVLAPTYSSSATYNIGDYVYYSGDLYRCIDAITTAEAWTASHWEQVALADDVSNLNSDLDAVGERKEESIAYSLTAGRTISPDGTIITSQTSFSITNKIGVTQYNSLIVTTEIGFGNMLYAFYDEDDTFISGKQSASGGYTTITNETVPVPSNASYIYVCARNNAYNVVLKGVYPYSLDLEGDVAQIEKQMSAYPAKITLDPVPFTQETGDYINSQGALVNQGNSYYTTGYVDVGDNDTLYITASANYENCLYAFYDAGKTPVFVGPASASSSTYTTYTDEPVSVPIGSKYIVVAGRFASLKPDIKVFDSYKPLGNWNGKKWVCVGDSLTEENAAASKHYFNYIADIADVSIVNMGVGGTGYKRGFGESKAFYQRIANVPVDADFVTIFGSGNDLNTALSYDIGTYTDSTTDTLCGCINATLDAFYAICPTVPIGIIAPTPWMTWPTTVPNNRMEQYVHAMKQVCEYRGVPFLDLYHYSNLRPENQANREACFYSQTLDGNGDGVHPNNLGHKIIAPKIYEFVKKLLIY